MKTKNLLLAGCLLVMLGFSGCTPDVKGVYRCQGGLLSDITLGSGGKAVVASNMFGMRQEKQGTYEVKDDRVRITIQGDTTVFSLKDKTLDGGGFVGQCTLQ